MGRYTGSEPPKEFPLPTENSAPTGIAVDAAGCAWYTAPGTNRIGRLCLRLPYAIFLPIMTYESEP